MTHDELRLSGLPDEVTETSSDLPDGPPPGLSRRSESSTIGPLHALRAAIDLAGVATGGSEVGRRRARRFIGVMAFVMVGLPVLLGIVIALT